MCVFHSLDRSGLRLTGSLLSNNAVFGALADPTRRRILRLLNGQEISAGDLSARFPISAPSMSHHFSVLREAGLIVSRREGQQILYSLNTTVVKDLVGMLLDIFAKPRRKS